jgi:hypothetical protein
MTQPGAITTSRLAYEMLREHTFFVIDDVKAPLQKAIQFAAKLLARKCGPISKETTCSPVVHAFLDIMKEFEELENNPDRIELFTSVLTIFMAEIEHDPYYRFRFDWLLEKMFEKILAGEWESRPLNTPISHWKEQPPFGGKDSIVYRIMQHKDEILKLIEKESNV